MYVFIYWIKAIAAILITNSHYGRIWPTSAMAFGGMLGNCLFFATAGFLLWNLKDSFPLWYCKRILRIYPVFWLAVLLVVYVLSKLMFDRYAGISGGQIINQIILFILVYQIFVLAEEMELHGSRLEKMPHLPALVRFLAALTLEIYVGQYLVIYLLPETRFPISFILTTGAIVLYAWLLHKLGSFVGKRLISKINRQGETGV